MSGPQAEAVARDLATRHLAQSEFVAPMVVEAGAGTGKTALLVARLVAWCVGPGWDLHERDGVLPERVARLVCDGVVAITFTEAAAAEMARKIGDGFSCLTRGTEPVGWDPDPALLPSDSDECQMRAAALADEVHRLQVSTIHAFCQRLLSAHPLEAGIHPRFAVDPDEALVEAVIEEVVDEHLRRLDDSAVLSDWQALASAGVDPPQLADALRYLVANGVAARDLEREPFRADLAHEFEERLRTAIAGFATAHGGRLESLPKKAKNGVVARDAVEVLAAGLEGGEGELGFEDLAARARAVGDTAMDRIREWGTGEFGKTEADCFADSVPAVAAASAELAAVLGALAPLRPAELAAARRVLGPLLAEIDARRLARGIVTYGDLLRRAARLLEASPGTVRELCAEIDQLLVDEFQDTDWVQCRLVERIAFGDGRRPGLFVVGDPKQSIYAWRNADLAAYASFVNSVEHNGGTVEPLVQNFRSVAPILTEVARVVGEVMVEHDGVQPEFVPLEPTDHRVRDPGFVDAGRAAVEYWATWPRTGDAPPRPAKSGEMVACEALAVADDIHRLASGHGVRWGDVAVLLRSTTEQERLLDAFRLRGVPFEVAREREFYRQREVVEAAALVRCVLDPLDRVALLTVLRSDAVGVPDVALAPLWDNGFPALVARLEEPEHSMLGRIDECIEAARAATPETPTAARILPRWPLAVRGAVRIVADLRSAYGRDTPDVFVERLRVSWMAEVSASARFLGRFRRARLERFFAHLERRMEDGGGDESMTRFLRQAVAEGGEGSVGAEPDLQADAVHVVTIHGAKGLDFEHVYLLQIHRQSRMAEQKAKPAALPSGDSWEYRIFGWPTPGFRSAAGLQDLQSRAETVRLLYVAMTRAKNRLVVSGGWKDGHVLDDPLQAKSFADLVGHRGEAGSIAAQARDGEERRADEASAAQWVLPALRDRSVDDDGGIRDANIAVPNLNLVRRDAELLAERRRNADQRMKRPFAGAASAGGHDGDDRLDAEESVPFAGESRDRDAAMAAGTILHRLLEELDLEQRLPDQLRAQGERAAAELGNLVGGEVSASARREMEKLVEQIAGGRCLVRLAEVGPRVVAREPAVIAEPDSDGGPVGAVTGFIDLVYRDPEDDRLVVADYKTDRVEGDEELAKRADIYRPQLETYARALRGALALDYEPRCELWFLRADEIVRL